MPFNNLTRITALAVVNEIHLRFIHCRIDIFRWIHLMNPLLGNMIFTELVDGNYKTDVLFSVGCRIKSSDYSSLQLPITIKYCRRSCPQSKTIYLVFAHLLVLYEGPKATVALLCRKHCYWWFVFLWWNLFEIADHAPHNVPSHSLSLK